MNNIEIFNNEQFGEVRIVMQDGEPWFVGKDIAIALGYKNPQRAIRDHIYDEDKGVTEMVTPGGKQNHPIINESGLYSLILSSKLPTARKFKHWVTSEILPCIRKSGAYITDPVLKMLIENPSALEGLIDNLSSLDSKCKTLHKKNTELAPKAAYYDAFIDPEDCSTIRVVAKLMNIAERKLLWFLVECGFLYRTAKGDILPYAKYRNSGLFRVKESNREGYTCAYTLITPKGKALFNQLVAESPKMKI